MEAVGDLVIDINDLLPLPANAHLRNKIQMSGPRYTKVQKGVA